MKRSLSFKEYLNKKLLPYKIILPLSLALITAIITAYSILIFYSDSDLSFAKAISPHLSTLIETQDGPELQRFITSVANEKGIKIEVFNNQKIIASSDSTTTIGNPLKNIGMDILGIQTKISSKNLISTAKIRRHGGPENLNSYIRIFNPIFELFFMVVIVSGIIFLLSFLILNILATKIILTAQKSIEPIKELENSISKLSEFGEVSLSNYMYIEELENIYNTILTTSSKLKISNENLAHSKAKALTVETYKRLIHDLHTPVAALKQMIKIINKDGIPQDKKDFAKMRVAEIAEQILFQVKASKGNLKLDIDRKDDDLNESVRKATGQAQMALAEIENVEISEKYDESLKSFLHDNMMLGRAVSNIIVNAIEACKGHVEVAVQKLNEEISISISDDGDGIKQEDVSLFLQGRGRSKKKNGVGLGLSSANHIVRLHGGKIIYRKSHLGGACFDIRMQG
ncbi:MAG: signal transduction histidine kinase [Bacteriovoracaceae bacterium]|jgi:signal transduction histidine kinase